MHLGAASAKLFVSGRATDWMRGLRRLSSPDKLRMGTNTTGSEGMGAKVHVREGKNPDHQLRSPNTCSVELTKYDY